MPEPKVGAESFEFHDPREIYHPGFSVAMDAPGTRDAENFIHAEDMSRVVVSSSDISPYVDDRTRGIIAEEFFLAQDGRARTSFFDFETTQILAAQHDRITPMRTHAIAFEERAPGSGEYRVFAAQASTAVAKTTYAYLEQAGQGRFRNSGYLEETAATIARFSEEMAQMKFFVEDLNSQRLVEVDTTSLMEHVFGPGISRMIENSGLGRDYEIHNARISHLANEMHAHFMMVNGIPGLSFLIDADTGKSRYDSLRLVEETESAVGAMTSPMRSPVDAINTLNTTAFLVNPLDPQFVFSHQQIEAYVEAACENRTFNGGGLTYTVEFPQQVLDALESRSIEPQDLMSQAVREYIDGAEAALDANPGTQSS